MTKFLPISDLHLEYEKEPFIIPKIEGVKYLVLAGDIGHGFDHLDFLKDCATKYEVIYILGNHEFYHSSFEATKREWSKVNIPHLNISIDQKLSFDDGVTFLGTTLWSNFKNHDPLLMVKAQSSKHEYKVIRQKNNINLITPDNIYQEFQRSFQFLESELLSPTSKDNSRTVVVTHFAPSIQSPSFNYPDQETEKSHLFASDLDDFIKKAGAKIWIHGHQHLPCDYTIGDTRIIARPRGFPFEDRKQFKLDVIEI